jgi:hypothetical protein
MDIDTRELAWAAGLFEGEGCISSRRRSTKRATHVATRQLAILVMTDEDTVRRFQAAVGVGTVYGPYQRPGKKPEWRWQTTTFEKAQAVIALLWFGLGARRRAHAASALGAATPPRALSNLKGRTL